MYRIPAEKKIRVIVDTDAACEADDQMVVPDNKKVERQ